MYHIQFFLNLGVMFAFYSVYMKGFKLLWSFVTIKHLDITTKCVLRLMTQTAVNMIIMPNFDRRNVITKSLLLFFIFICCHCRRDCVMGMP